METIPPKTKAHVPHSPPFRFSASLKALGSFFALFLTFSFASAQPSDTLYHAPFNLPDGAVQCNQTPPKWARHASNASVNGAKAHLEVRNQGFEARNLNGTGILYTDTIEVPSGDTARAEIVVSGQDLDPQDSIQFLIRTLKGQWVPFEKRGGNFTTDTVRSPTFTENVLLRVKAEHPPQGGNPTRTHRIEEMSVIRAPEFGSVRISPESPSICEGECVYLTAHPSGLNPPISYNWFPATGLSSVNGKTVEACPKSTTKYTVIASGSSPGDFAMSSVKVEVDPAPSLHHATTNFPNGGQKICQKPGEQCADIIVNTDPGASLEVSPEPSNIFCNPFGGCQIEVCPKKTTTYSITASSPQYECDKTIEVTVPVEDCRCNEDYFTVSGSNSVDVSNLPPFIWNSGTINKRNVAVPAGLTLIIDQPTTIKGSKFKMGEGSKIVVSPFAQLNITDANSGEPSQFYSCTRMWEGIEASGELTVDGNSIIEDAINGITIPDNGLFTGGLTLDNVRLNKNLTHVRVKARSTPISPFSITGTEFTCHSIYSPDVLLKGPHSDKVTRTGIFIEPNEQNGIQVGDPGSDANIFSRIQRGVVGKKATFTAKNNTFKNLRPFEFPPKGVELPDGTSFPGNQINPGIGILGYQNFSVLLPPKISPSEIANSRVTNNRFYDCRVAVRFDNYKDVKVNNNEIDEGEVPLEIACYPRPWSFITGSVGIYVKENDPKYQSDFQVEDNQIDDQNRGIVIQYAQEPDFGDLSIRDNVIKTTEFGSSLASLDKPTSDQGVSVSSANPKNLVVGTPWKIFSNDIEDVIEGIRLSTLRNHYKWIAANNIKIDPYPQPDGLDLSRANNNIFRHNTGMRMTLIHWGKVEVNDLSSSVPPDAPEEPFLHRGYVGEETSFIRVSCNKVHDVGEGFHFYNYNTTWNGIVRNRFNAAYHRAVVLSNGGGIGPQGDQPSLVSDNEWDQNPVDVSYNGSTRQGYDTYSQFSSNTGANSIFYVRAPEGDVPYNPPPSLEEKLNPFSEVVKTTQVDNPPSQPSFCPETEEALADFQEPGQNKEKVIRDVAGDSLSYDYAPIGGRKWAVYHAYLMIKGDSSLPGSDSLLIAFEDSVDQANIGTCRSIDEEREAENINLASSMNSSMICDNPWDSTFKAFNKIYLDSWGRDSALTQTQINDLWVLANKCPITHGPGVYRSRNLLLHVADTLLRFDENCPSTGSVEEERSSGGDGDKEKIKADWAPNPTEGATVLHYEFGKEHQGATLLLRNAMGRIVKRIPLNGVKGRERLELENEENGMYFYEIRNKEHQLKTGKLILTR